MTEKTKPKTTAEIYPLKYPIIFGETSIVELTLRRAKAKDMIAIENAQDAGAGSAMITLAFLASINGVPVEALEELDAEDLTDVSEKIVGFLPQRFQKGAPAP
jgi:hypothetical protein